MKTADVFELRRILYQWDFGLPRTFEALRRVMHQLRTLDEGELPEDCPAIGYHPPEFRDDSIADAAISDEELALL